MKTITYKSCLSIVAFVLLAQSILAKGEDAEKSKNIKKSYPVDQSIKLSINNQFGKVHVNTWDKNVIEVDITIKAVKSSDSKAQEAIDRIKIEISEEQSSKKMISFKTVMNGKFNNSKGEEVSIDYTINMPASNPLRVENSFGDVYLANFSGDLLLEVGYGNLKAENIKGLAEIELEFSKGEISSMTSGKLEVSYSKLNIDELGKVEIENEFSDLNIGKANELNLESKYGSVEIEEVQSLETDVEFSGFKVNKLYRSLKADMQYPNNAKVSWISKDASLIDITTSFGSIDLGLQKGISASVDLKNSFGSISTPTEGFDFSYIKKEDFEKEFRGTTGQGSKSKIRIVTSYGKIKLTWVD